MVLRLRSEVVNRRIIGSSISETSTRTAAASARTTALARQWHPVRANSELLDRRNASFRLLRMLAAVVSLAMRRYPVLRTDAPPPSQRHRCGRLQTREDEFVTVADGPLRTGRREWIGLRVLQAATHRFRGIRCHLAGRGVFDRSEMLDRGPGIVGNSRGDRYPIDLVLDRRPVQGSQSDGVRHERLSDRPAVGGLVLEYCCVVPDIPGFPKDFGKSRVYVPMRNQ
jgi:hypothetical protein